MLTTRVATVNFDLVTFTIGLHVDSSLNFKLKYTLTNEAA